MSYVIAPYKLIKGENAWGEFLDVMRELQARAIDRARAVWPGYDFGGVMPGDKQFGICPLRAREMASDVTATTLSGTYTFRKYLGTTGWHTLFNYTTRTDVMHCFAGFAITDEVLRILELRWQVSDR